MDDEMTVEEMAPQATATIRLTARREQLGEVFAEVLPEVWGAVEAAGATPAGPPFARYFGPPGDELDVEAGMPAAGSFAGSGRVRPSELPGGRAATAVHVGPYDTLRETYERLEAWMGQNGIAPGDGPWEVYETDPGEQPDPARWRTRVVWPIAP